MGSKDKINYVEEADLQEDVRTLYETGNFPERLTKALMDMVEGIIHSRRFCFYTADWKDDMKSNALTALVTTLNEKRYDITRTDTKFFSWATRVIFNQFYNTIAAKKREIKHQRKYIEEMPECESM